MNEGTLRRDGTSVVARIVSTLLVLPGMLYGTTGLVGSWTGESYEQRTMNFAAGAFLLLAARVFETLSRAK